MISQFNLKTLAVFFNLLQQKTSFLIWNFKVVVVWKRLETFTVVFFFLFIHLNRLKYFLMIQSLKVRMINFVYGMLCKHEFSAQTLFYYLGTAGLYS